MAGKDKSIGSITARHSFWADWIFMPYVSRLLKHHFHAIHILGEVPNSDLQHPLIIVPNHSTWWDGFFIYILNKKIIKRKLYLMMLDEQLANYSFFTRLGAYGITPQSRRSIHTSLNYTVTILKDPSNAVCIFPQGELKYFGIRPLGFKRGMEWILKKYGKTVYILPMGIRSEFLEDQRPDVFFMFEKVYRIDYESFPGIGWLEEVEHDLLDRLIDAIIRGERGTILLKGSLGADERWNSFRHKIRNRQ